MTWGRLIDTRRALALFFVLAFVILLALFLCLFVLANTQIISTNPDAVTPLLLMLNQLL